MNLIHNPKIRKGSEQDMKRKLISMFLTAALFVTQIYNMTFAADSDPDFTKTQSSIPTVSGNGIFLEAENCSYTSWYTLKSNSSASGKYVLQANTEQRTATSKRGEFEVKFNASKAGTYIVWLRVYASGSSQDSYYAAFQGQGYTYCGIEPTGSFAWIKSANITLKAGEQANFMAFPREKGHLIDAVIITQKNFVPSGVNGNIPEGEYGNAIVSSYAPTPYQPPSEHPRVFFTAADIPRIRSNMLKPQNVPVANWLNELKSVPPSGDSNGTYDERMLREIEAFAFDYAINQNTESGEIAVSALMTYLETADPAESGNETRNGGTIMFRASEVYDWCYDLMTDEQRETVIGVCEGYAHNMEIKWPPNSQGSVVGHGSEAQLLRDMLCFAIATYDERPDIWEAVAGRFYEEYTDARDYFNKGHFALQGDSYGLYRHRWDTYSYLLITGMGLPSPYNAADLAQVSYGPLYMRRPDGQYLRDGDSADDTSYGMWEMWSGYGETYISDSAIIGDPYLKDEAFAMAPNGEAMYWASPIVYLVVNDPDLEKASVSNLPKSRFFDDPAGVMVARTGWDRGVDTNDVVCEMKIGGVYQANHQHYDAGHFQIYYKGILASDSGVYQGLDNSADEGGTSYNSAHRKQYMIRTIAHNSVLVYNSDDGGQRVIKNDGEPGKISTILEDIDEYRVADVLAHEIDPKNPIDPEYTYIKGDLKPAYSSKVSDFKRSFMFLNLFEDEVPAALIVFDKVTSSSKAYKKTWLLHGVERPVVNGTQTIFSRTYKSNVTPSGYNGKMTVDTLLPKSDNADLSVVGGEEEGFSIVNGTDYTGYPASTRVDEGNTYRLEISPKTQSATDCFLNVIQVSDNDKNYYADTEIIETSLFYGAKIRDRAVLFSKSDATVSNSFSVTVPSNYKITVCDVRPGIWNVASDNGTQTVLATEDGGVLSFEASGTVVCSFKETATPMPYIAPTLKTDNEYRVKLANRYVNGKEKAEMKNGTLMFSLSTLAEWFNIKLTTIGGVATLSRGNETAYLQTGSNNLQFNDYSAILSEAPYLKNGEIMVPLRDFTESFGGEMVWYDISKTAVLDRPPVDYSLPDGYADIANVTPDSGSVDGGNVCTNAVDCDADTIWAAKGVGRYIDIELSKRQEIDRIEILFNPNGSRNAEFEIMVSDDGVNYTSIMADSSDGSLEGVSWETYPLSEPVITKYIRYVGNGSNISTWNAIKEIRFRLYDDPDGDTLPENNLKALYSATGSDFAYVPDMKDSNTEYEIILPDNSKYVYLKFEVPAGCSAPDTVRYGWNAKYAEDWFGGSGGTLLGTADTESASIDSHVLCQTKIPMMAAQNGGIYKVPIKNEYSSVSFTYTDENGTSRDYNIDFRAKQPRLTSFTNVLSSRYGSQLIAKVVFVSGAAVNNDNGSIVHSGVKDLDKIKVMANTSEELLGGSLFMLPFRSSGAENLFTFTADHGGKIYVLSDEPISGTGYSSGWICENSGTLPVGMQEGTSITIPRDNNSFSGIYSLSLNWRADKRSSDFSQGTKNYYRAVSPAISGNLSSTYVTGGYAMKYAYSKTFSAGEPVTVPGTGNTSPDTAVIVKWDGDEITNDVSYSVSKKGKLTVNSNGIAPGNTLISALYSKNGSVFDLKVADCSGTATLQMNADMLKAAAEIKFFIWNMHTLESFANKIYHK